MFKEGLNNVISFLQEQKRKGVKYVSLSRETYEKLFIQNTLTNSPRPVALSIKTASSPQPFQQTAPTRKNFSPTPYSKQTITNLISSVSQDIPIQSSSKEINLDIPLSLEEKQKKMSELFSKVMLCSRCPHLAASRKNIVFGIGDISSPLMFIGEAPGADEDKQGEPFVGRAGQLLTKIIAAMGLSREKVFIANILKCRPDTPGATSGNRPPTPQEMQICMPWLKQQIEIIQPKVIVALGTTAVKGLLSQNSSLNNSKGQFPPISRLRGHFQNFHGIQVMPTFHPSYLLRYGNNNVKRSVWEDMLQVMDYLKLPISDKQRNYFLSNH